MLLFSISADTISKLGLYLLLPIFIAGLLFIALDIAKRSGMGRFGTIMAMMVLGAGIFVFIIKMVMELFYGAFVV